MNEFSAAMGLAVLDNIDKITEGRKLAYEQYIELLPSTILPPTINFANINYSYFPILLKDEEQLLSVRQALLENNIVPRRYFYPSLNMLNYLNYQSCPVSEDISKRILCLSIFCNLNNSQVKTICDIIIRIINEKNTSHHG